MHCSTTEWWIAPVSNNRKVITRFRKLSLVGCPRGRRVDVLVGGGGRQFRRARPLCRVGCQIDILVMRAMHPA
eukprot:4724913-Pleurochrysis_carterae.AAC.1